jgi:hypothetical protein
MGRRRHWKPPPGGAFGKGGKRPDVGPSGSTSGRDQHRERSTTDSQQKRYSSINVGDTIEIHSAEKGKGQDLTKQLGPYRVFIISDGIEPGWSGKVEIISQNKDRQHLYTAKPLLGAHEPEVIEAKFEPPPEKEQPDLDMISLGDLGATKKDTAVFYVPKEAREMPSTKGLEYTIRNGPAATQQGESIRAASIAHLDTGRPLYQIDGKVPDEKKTLGEYIDAAKKALKIGVGEKEEEVKPAAAAEVVDKPKQRRKPKIVTPEPVPVRTGARSHGAYSLDTIVRYKPLYRT